MEKCSGIQEKLRILEERLQKIERNASPKTTEVAKALLSGALPRQRIHLVQEIARINRIAVLGAMGVWTLCLSRHITDWRVAWASGLSSVLIGLWRLYARWIDDKVAGLYPAFFQYEEDLKIPKKFSQLSKIRKSFNSAEEVHRCVSAKRIGTRGHLFFDWLGLLGIVIMAVVTIIYGNARQLSWFELKAPFHPYVVLFLNFVGILLVLWAMNAFQTNNGGLKKLLQRKEVGTEICCKSGSTAEPTNSADPKDRAAD